MLIKPKTSLTVLIGQVILLTLLYFIVGKLGLALAFVNPSATAIWPPTGIALAACLLLGYNIWPGILAGAFLVNITTSGVFATSMAIALGNTLEALVGAYLVNRFANGRHVFNRAQDIFKFAVLVGVVSAMLSATIGVTSLALSGLATWDTYASIWLTWWLGDATGAFLVAPTLITWMTHPWGRPSRRRILEVTGLGLSLVGIGLAIFDGVSPLGAQNYPLAFLALPLIIWASFRFGQRGAAAATLILSGLALWGTLNGFGPFARDNPNESLLIGQLFLGTITLTGLSLAAVVAERRQVEHALRLSHDQLTAILQGAADGILTLDPSGHIRYANDAAARLMGYASIADLLAAPAAEIRQKFEIQDEAGQPFPTDRLPGRVVLQGASQASATIHYRNKITGDERWSLDKSTAVFDANGQVALAVNILHDITELKRAELSQHLLAEVGRLLAGSLDGITRLSNVARLVVQVMADWCVVDILDPDGTIRRIAVAHPDPAKVEYAHEQQQRHPIDWAAPNGVAQVLHTGQSEFYPTISPSMLEALTRDAVHLRLLRDVNLRSVMIVPLVAHGRVLGAISFIWAESERIYTAPDLALAEEIGRRAGLALDHARLYTETQQLNAELEQRIHERTAQLQHEIAERWEALRRLEESQAQLRQLSAHQHAAREEERLHIARELHDELGQILTGLKIDVASLRRSLGNQVPSLQQKLEDMSQLIDATIQSIRRMVTELRPSILDDFGLAAAIEWQLTEFQRRTGITCQLMPQRADESSLDLEHKTALFRIFQETLTNVARHANATTVVVKLEEIQDYLLLEVQDNGRGIAPEDMAKSRSFGLLGMRERVTLLSGEFSLKGVPGQGTTLVVRIPLGQNANAS